MSSVEIVSLLGVKTLILTVAVLLVSIFLRIFPLRSPGLHRAIWGCTLLLGFFGAGIPVSIPVEHRVAEAEKPTPVAPPILVEPKVFSEAPLIVTPISVEPTLEIAAQPQLPQIATPQIATDPVEPPVSFSQRIEAVRPYVFPALVAIWAAGLVYFVVRRIVRYCFLLAALKTATEVDGADAVPWNRMLQERGIDSRKLRMLLTDNIGPALVPLPRGPAVVVPRDFWEDTDERIQSGILRHELAHYRQRDLWICGAVRFLAVLHWFNPLAYLAALKFEEATEWACDAAAFGDHELGELHFAESMLALHETTPSLLLNRSAFAGGKLSQRARLLNLIITQPKESAMKKITIAFLALLLLVAGVLHFRFVVANNPGDAQNNTNRHRPVKNPSTLKETFDSAITNSENPTMTLTVLDPDGKPIPDAFGKTHRFDRDQQRIFKRFNTDADGKAVFELPKKSNVGTFTITVQQPGYTVFHARWELENQSGDLPAACSVKLEKAKTVGGVVVDETGKPIADVKVSFSYPMGRHTNGDPNLGASCEATTDAEGHWTYASLPLDITEPRGGLLLLHPDYLPTEIEGVTFSDFAPAADGSFSRKTTIRKGLDFGGVIKDNSGKPIAGAKVEVEFSDVYGGQEQRYRKVEANSEGRFVFNNCPISRKTFVVGSAPGFASFWTETKVLPDAKPIELTLPPAKPLVLKIVDTAGKPIRNAYAWLNSWGPFQSYGPLLSSFLRDEKNWSASIILPVDDEGVWTWNDAPFGPFAITIEAPGHMGQRAVDVEGGMEPKTITLAYSLEITGKVVEDTTGKAIDSFRVTEGFYLEMPALRNLPHQTSWQTQDTTNEKNGTFSRRFESAYPERRLRVEADGYEQCDSESIDNNAGKIELVFRMKRFSPEKLAEIQKIETERSIVRTGRIVTPDGKPASYAKVIYATSSPSDGIGLTMSYLEGHAHRTAESDQDGVFKLLPMELDTAAGEKYAFVVIHDAGFLRVEQEEFEKTYDTAIHPNAAPIKLQPWGKIEGTLRIGSKPGQGLTVDLRSVDRQRGVARIDIHDSAKTDEEGRFLLRKVAPGVYYLNQMLYVSTGGGGSMGFALNGMMVSVKPGESQTVQLGGTGRPVVGKIAMTPELEKIFAGENQRVCISEVLPPPPGMVPPPLPKELEEEMDQIRKEIEKVKDDPAKVDELRNAFTESESGKKLQAIYEEYEKNSPSTKEREKWNEKNSQVMQIAHQAVIAKDGTFRVEDVPAGNWMLRVDLYDENFKNLGSANPQEFTIPEIPGSRSDEPLDVGTITVE